MSGGFGYTPIAATTAAVADRIVAVANMKVGTYTIANPSPVWAGGALLTLTHAEVGGGVDTLGTVVIVGRDLNGATITETLTPVADSVVTSTKVFRSVTSATGVGWVIGTGNDTISIGVAAGAVVADSGGTLRAIVINTTAAAAVVVSDARGTIATLKSSIAEGTYYYDLDYSGYLKVATTSTNNVTVVHTPTIVTAYATA